jgi:hypothetical protein
MVQMQAKCMMPWKVINHGDNNDPNVTIIVFTLLEYIK